MVKPSHISLKQRKALSAQMVSLQPLHSEESAFGRAGIIEALNQFQRDIVQQSCEGLNSPDTDRLDSFLHWVSSNLHPKPVLNGQGEALFERLLGKVREGLNSIKCSECVASRKICDGTPYLDDEIVDAGGKCIQRLKAMFDDAEAMTRKYYEEYSTVFSSCKERAEVIFSTSPCEGKAHLFDNPYTVGGVTKYHDDPSGSKLTSEVEIRISTGSFDRESYLACLYVFFHECICHAFQGIATTHGRKRSSPSVSDPFAEGWMDYIAVSILLDSPMSTRANDVYKADLEDGIYKLVAFNYHASRFECRKAKSRECAKTLSHWLHGTEVAHRFQEFLDGIPSLPRASRAMFWGISMDLNLLPYNSEDRELFMFKLEECLKEDGETTKSLEYKRLVAAMKNYRDSSDLHRLISEMRLP